MSKYFSSNLLVKHALGLLLITACLLLSNWQWDRAHYTRQATLGTTPIQFEKLSNPRDYLPPSSVGQVAKVAGTWQTTGRVLLPNRPVDGRELISGFKSHKNTQLGNWIIDLLRLEDGTSVAVVRGWQSSDHTFPNAIGRANILGLVQPAEDAPNDSVILAKPLITTKFLLQHAQTDVRDGFIVQSQAPASLSPITPSRQAFKSNGLRTLNVFYTFNWIFFAFLILLIWIRIVRGEVSSAT